MTAYSPDEYFKNLYPDWFRETTVQEAFIYVGLFFLLMLALGMAIRKFNQEGVKMLISNSKHKIGDEIDCGIHMRGNNECRVTIRKTGATEWMAYKFGFRTKKEVPLRKGDLKKIVDYMNRNFGYDDEMVD